MKQIKYIVAGFALLIILFMAFKSNKLLKTTHELRDRVTELELERYYVSRFRVFLGSDVDAIQMAIDVGFIRGGNYEVVIDIPVIIDKPLYVYKTTQLTSKESIEVRGGFRIIEMFTTQ